MERGAALFAYLDADVTATDDYHGIVFCDFRSLDRQPGERYQRLPLHELHCPRLDTDECDYQFLWQCGGIVLQRKIPAQYRGNAGIAVAKLSDHDRLCRRRLGARHDLWVAVSVLILTSVLFSLGGLINAIYASSFDDITIIPTFVLTPLTYLGGVFYTVTMLPPFWQSLSLANPILYMVNAFRYGLLGVSDVHLGVAYLAIIGFIVGLFWYTLSLLNRGYGIRT